MKRSDDEKKRADETLLGIVLATGAGLLAVAAVPLLLLV